MYKFVMHSDPGHGWLEVPRSLLDTLCIAGDVSKYSYIDGAHAYLEEDCDAPRLLRALEERGELFTLRSHHLNRDHWIRSLQRFF